MAEVARVDVHHHEVEANGARFHVAEAGTGAPLLLLHGWPEYWATWQPMMDRLGGRFRLLVPDLRGFGESDKPSRPFGPAQHAADMAALIETLRLAPVGIVAHDVGASVAQELARRRPPPPPPPGVVKRRDTGGPEGGAWVALVLARRRPDLVRALFFFNLVYPGIGARFTTPDHLRFVWHTYFNQSDLAPRLLRSSADGVRLFVEHLVRLWAHRDDAVDDTFIAALATNLARPGNLEGGFDYYRGAAVERARVSGGGEEPVPIGAPTCVRWTEGDRALPLAWSDRLPDFFTDLDFASFSEAGHFPHHEQPDRAAAEIAGFFSRLDAR